MTELQPVFLHREFKAIVQKVSDKLTSKLQAFDSKITGIHYLYGHPLEIVNILKEKSEGGSTKFQRYPLVAFFLDSEVDRTDFQFYGEQRCHLAVIRPCKFDGTEKAEQRDLKNFIPVLTPIYMELLRQINYSGVVESSGENSFPHKVTNRYYWGREGLFGNQGNIFDDRVDAIEIEDLKLKINLNYCPKQA